MCHRLWLSLRIFRRVWIEDADTPAHVRGTGYFPSRVPDGEWEGAGKSLSSIAGVIVNETMGGGLDELPA